MTRKLASLLLALTVTSASLLSGCALSCTAVGCGPSLTINVEGSPPLERTASYRVEITTNGSTNGCDLTFDDQCQPRVQCDSGTAMFIEASSCGLDGAVGTLRSIRVVPPAGDTVGVRVLRGTQVLGEQSFTPSYTTSQPNGPACAPTCRSATVTLSLSSGGS